MISYWDHPTFPDGPMDLFYTRVRCLWETYGSDDLAEFWVQRVGGEITAWLCRSEECLTISAVPNANWEELAEFVLFLGASVVYGPTGLMLPSEYTLQTGDVLRWCGESQPPPRFAVINDPSGNRLYTLLVQCQSDSLSLPSRDGFLSDYFRRVRLRTGRAKLLCADSEDAAAVITTAETWATAVIGGVAALPKYRGRGLATAAVSLMADELSSEGKQVFLAAGNAPLTRFYEDRGFVRCGVWRQWKRLG